MLKHPDPNKIFYVTTDASGSAIAGILSQGDPPNDRPLQYYSRVLSEVEKRYSTIEREALAIVDSIHFFRNYLTGKPFVVITDHQPLCHLFAKKKTSLRLHRFRAQLMDMSFKVLYRAGRLNAPAVCLSRDIAENAALTIPEVLKLHNIEPDEHFCNFALANAVTRANAQEKRFDFENMYHIEENNNILINDAKSNFRSNFLFSSQRPVRNARQN